jgi:iron(II)-dependent oxidoreductase
LSRPFGLPAWLALPLAAIAAWLVLASALRLAPEAPGPPSHVDRAGMVRIPAGPFWYGCVDGVDAQCEAVERPGASRELDEFWIDRHEVSVREYRECVVAGVCSSEGLKLPIWFHGERHPEFAWSCNWGKRGREEHPLNCVSWYQAARYCSFRGKRLPTDAEWEKAARGSEDRRVYPWGDRGLAGPGAPANIADLSALRTFRDWPDPQGYDDGAVATAARHSYARGSSPYGVEDMIGNVEEWTRGWYDRTKLLRSIRGASWHRAREHARISHRYPSEPASHPDYGGFRCAFSGGSAGQ